jgi:electron transfer flavoprotein beta subunit
MHIYVCIKQVPDTETKIKIKSDQSGIDIAGIKWIISPYDEMAIEEAIRVKEKNAGSTVTVISCGPVRVTEGLRKALAMGADQAVHVEAPETLDSFVTAKAIANIIQKNGDYHLIFCGKEAIDDGASQVGQMIAALLKSASVGVVLNVQYEAASVTCKREVEGGTFEIVKAQFPVLITVQKGLNEPRYPNVQSMMQARKKELKTYSLTELGLSDKDQKIRYVHFELPPPKPPGKKITGEPQAQVKELVRLLREESKVI